MERVIGRIAGAHGIRGDVNVDIRTDEPKRRFAPGSSVLVADHRLTVKSARRHGDRMIVTFAEIKERNAAEALRGATIRIDVDPTDLPDETDEFYDHQLVGLEVKTPDGASIGRVAEVLHLPAQDSLVVDVDDREILIPFVMALVPDVDIDGGFVTVVDLPGLIDSDDAEIVDANNAN